MEDAEHRAILGFCLFFVDSDHGGCVAHACTGMDKPKVISAVLLSAFRLLLHGWYRPAAGCDRLTRASDCFSITNQDYLYVVLFDSYHLQPGKHTCDIPGHFGQFFFCFIK